MCFLLLTKHMKGEICLLRKIKIWLDSNKMCINISNLPIWNIDKEKKLMEHKDISCKD